jgi:hypothetical protein
VYARDINYNYFADEDETVIEPFVWKNSVLDMNALTAIQSPVDGETRKVLTSGDWYQYSAKLSLWRHITKERPSRTSLFFFDTQMDECPKYEVDVMTDQTFSLRTDGDVSPATEFTENNHFSLDNNDDVIPNEVTYEE